MVLRPRLPTGGGTVRLAAALLLLLAGSCSGPGCPSNGGGDVCADAPYGYAEVTGRAVDADGDPIPGKRASVACGAVVGVYDDVTDAGGRFEVLPVYGSLPDSNLVPLPPREPDGSFLVPCDVGVRVSHADVLEQRGVAVRFFPAREDVIATHVSLDAASRTADSHR